MLWKSLLKYLYLSPSLDKANINFTVCHNGTDSFLKIFYIYLQKRQHILDHFIILLLYPWTTNVSSYITKNEKGICGLYFIGSRLFGIFSGGSMLFKSDKEKLWCNREDTRNWGWKFKKEYFQWPVNWPVNMTFRISFYNLRTLAEYP